MTMLFIWTNSFIYSIYSCLILSFSAHPIYLSSTEIDYKNKEKVLEISVKIFADDLEDVLSRLKKQKIELGTDRENPKTKEYLMDYLQDNLFLFTDRKERIYKYIGHEAGSKSDMFAMYIYLEVQKVEPFKILKVKNTILLDNFQNQLNFISCHTKQGIKKEISKKSDFVKEIYW